jgi:molybdopterin-guanine dinucleotide biosynthesis protein A
MKHLHVSVCVLAGGRSSRMGQDKARLRLGKGTLLGQVRATAQALGLPVRIIRHDLVPGCGPLGGVFTALKTSRADAEIFLACDMPFVSPALLARLVSKFRGNEVPVFVAGAQGPGFPFLLPQTGLELVEQQLEKKEFSLRTLAKLLKAQLLRPTAKQRHDLLNINTLRDLKEAQHHWRYSAQSSHENRPLSKLRQTPRGRKIPGISGL